MITARHLALSAVVASMALACGNRNATKPGTKVLAWEAGEKTSMTDVTVGAPIGPRTQKDLSFTATPKVGGGPVTYKLHVEFAELSLQAPSSQEMEFTKTTRAPVKIDVTLEGNEDWTVTATCQPTLLVGMPAAEGGKLVVRGPLHQRCLLVQKQGENNTTAVTLEVFGDERIEPKFLGGDVKVDG